VRAAALGMALSVSACASKPEVRHVGSESLERWVRGERLFVEGERAASIEALLEAASLLARHPATPFEGDIDSDPGRPTGASLEPRLATPALALSTARNIAASNPEMLERIAHAETALSSPEWPGPRVVARVIGPDGRDFIDLGVGSFEVVVLGEGRSVLDLWVVDDDLRTVCSATGVGRVVCRWGGDVDRHCDVVVRNSGPVAERYVFAVR